MSGVPRNDPLLLEKEASSRKGEMAEPQHSPNLPIPTADKHGFQPVGRRR